MSGEHWYTIWGEAAHTQPTKSKTAKNPTRPTTIRDAKALKLLPSVSGILKVINNPALERWKFSEIVRACYENPPDIMEDLESRESLDDYTKRILDMAFNVATDAADLGTRIHANIEAVLKKEVMLYEDEFTLALNAVKAMDDLGIDVVESEFCTTCPEYGYAGTTDVAFTKGEVCGILDFKSKKTKEGEPIIPSFGHAAQIAAYHVSYWTKGDLIKDNSVGYNVYISTTEPGRVEVVKYDADTLRREFEMFTNALAIWRHKNNYDPRQ